MLNQAFEFIKMVKPEFDKQEFISDLRNTIYHPLFNNSFHHSVAVLVLIKEELHSSSEALLRPVIESYLRAMWAKYCATSTQLNTLHNGKENFPKLSTLLNQIEKEVPDYQGTDVLTKKIKPLVSNLHDFTHGGIQSIAKQYSGDSLSNQRTPEDIKAKIKLVVFITYLVLCDTSEPTDTNLELFHDELQKLISL